MSMPLRFWFGATNYFDLDLLWMFYIFGRQLKATLYFSLATNINKEAYLSFCTLQHQWFLVGSLFWSFFTWSTQFDQVNNRFWDEFGRQSVILLIHGLSMFIRWFHATDGGFLWWLALLLWLSTFIGLIFIIIWAWIDLLMNLLMDIWCISTHS